MMYTKCTKATAESKDGGNFLIHFTETRSTTVFFSKDTQTAKGCKNGIMKITGSQAYKYLKCESGVHK